MPPKFKFTKDEITKAALDLTREKGISGLTARALAAKLGCSVKPIFGLFQNMEEVSLAVLTEAEKVYYSYLENEMAADKYPAYKASGMGYIRFAKEETELFKLLFMRDRSLENTEENREAVKPLVELIKNNTGLSDDDAYMFHIEMWIYVHGIATMIATSYLDWDMEFVSRTLSDGYFGLKHRYLERGNENGSN